MARAHTFVKRSRTGIGLDYHSNRAETSGPGHRPVEQQAANSGSQQSGLNKELQQVCVRARDFELSQPDNSGIAFGDLNVGGPELVGTQRQFSPASNHECVVITPDSFRAEAQFT